MADALLSNVIASRVGRGTVAAVLLLASGCGGPEPEATGSSDPCATSSLAAIGFEDGEGVVRLDDRASVALTHAPQGGYVLMVGAELHGPAGESPQIYAELVDAVSGELVAEAVRHTVLAPTGERDVWQTDSRSINHFAHLPVCPRQDGGEVAGLPHVLTVELATPSCTISTALDVVPTCDGSDDVASCECECSPTFFDGCP